MLRIALALTLLVAPLPNPAPTAPQQGGVVPAVCATPNSLPAPSTYTDPSWGGPDSVVQNSPACPLVPGRGVRMALVKGLLGVYDNTPHAGTSQSMWLATPAGTPATCTAALGDYNGGLMISAPVTAKPTKFTHNGAAGPNGGIWMRGTGIAGGCALPTDGICVWCARVWTP